MRSLRDLGSRLIEILGITKLPDATVPLQYFVVFGRDLVVGPTV